MFVVVLIVIVLSGEIDEYDGVMVMRLVMMLDVVFSDVGWLLCSCLVVS